MSAPRLLRGYLFNEYAKMQTHFKMPGANAAPFSWYAEGQLDWLLGKPFGPCPAPNVRDRESWEQGYIDAQKKFPQAHTKLMQSQERKARLLLSVVSSKLRLSEV